MVLYVATSNPGKLRDFATAAASAHLAHQISILPLPGLHEIPAPEEDQPTFAGNAILKACYYSRYAPGHIVLADDSGLEVDALHGAPGVRSARYADDVAQQVAADSPIDPALPPTIHIDTRNNLTLIHALASSKAPTPHIARYRCVLAAARCNGEQPAELLSSADGTVEGEILAAPQGSDGFGYDPLFYLPDHRLTMAELDPVTRLSLSHRGRALAALLPTLTGR
jgi:XTP/dITP diphosphohydrolase